MDTKELQIGDLVLYTEFGKNEFHRVEIVEPTRVWLNGCNTYVPDEFIKPIPITPEILEKNGFVRIEEYEKYEWSENSAEEWVIFEQLSFSDDLGVVYVEDYSRQIPLHYHNSINYVHELQHAFRLCGINKDIVL